MSLPFSKTKVDALGDRLRKAMHPAAEDIQMLQQVVAAYDPVLELVNEKLGALGYEANGRLKTRTTLIEKLRRPSRLSTIRDVAGTRVVLNVTLSEQDRVSRSIASNWSESQLIDRRENPSSGYRAVHVEVIEAGLPVEIQVRTYDQHQWAEIYEALADRWGRQIRYGELPDDPDGDFNGSSRREVVALLQDLGVYISKFEISKDAHARARERIDEADLRSDEAELQLAAAEETGREPTAEQEAAATRLRAEVEGCLSEARELLDESDGLLIELETNRHNFTQLIQHLQELFGSSDRTS